MTALAANTPRQYRNTRGAALISRVVKTAKKVYEGSIVTQIKATTGNPAEPATNDAAANVFLGIALAECATGDGSVTTQCISGPGVEVRLPIAATLTKSKVNTLVYAADDAGVTDATTLGPSIGILVEHADAGYGWISLRMPAMTANT